MPADIPLRCTCGALHGTALAVSPDTGCRVVCYCDDCQAFARFLGGPPNILDEWGGTDIFQMAPSRVRITGDLDALACMRLSEKGLYRWYCGKCKTPIGNTVGPRVPFVGLIHSFMDHEADGRARDRDRDRDREAVLGKPLGYVQRKFAVGTPPNPGNASLYGVIGRSAKLLTKWWLTGAGWPSPFFDEKTRAPRVTPRVLTVAERRAL